MMQDTHLFVFLSLGTTASINGLAYVGGGTRLDHAPTPKNCISGPRKSDKIILMKCGALADPAEVWGPR